MSKNGFTLVELAIALMVIGLLIGGVLKGQELIENARMLRVVRDYHDFKTAMMIFKSTYNALPGDIRRTDKIPNCFDRCLVRGNNDGFIGNISVLSVSIGGGRTMPQSLSMDDTGSPVHIRYWENENFWNHLASANMLSVLSRTRMIGSYLIPAPDAPIREMIYAIRSYDGVGVGEPLSNPKQVFLLLMMPATLATANRGLGPREASKFDEKLDDGKPFSGNVRALGGYNTNVLSNCANSDTNEYSLHRTGNAYRHCNLGFAID